MESCLCCLCVFVCVRAHRVLGHARHWWILHLRCIPATAGLCNFHHCWTQWGHQSGAVWCQHWLQCWGLHQGWLHTHTLSPNPYTSAKMTGSSDICDLGLSLYHSFDENGAKQGWGRNMKTLDWSHYPEQVWEEKALVLKPSLPVRPQIQPLWVKLYELAVWRHYQGNKSSWIWPALTSPL